MEINPSGKRIDRVYISQGVLVSLWSMLLLCGSATGAWATIPLVGDDTGTQGKGKFQIELFGEYANDEGRGLKERTTNLSATFTYGLIDPLDLAVTVPYQHVRTDEAGVVTKEDGLSDITVEAKWKFYESGNWSLALKPGLTLPTGSDARGLGTGRTTYRILFITTYNAGEERLLPKGRKVEGPEEEGPHRIEWSLNGNAGYTRNENTVGERTDLWFFSVSGSAELAEEFHVVADLGARTNTNARSVTHPAYFLLGIIYSLSENLELGLGVKFGLNHVEADYSIRGGVTVRF